MRQTVYQCPRTTIDDKGAKEYAHNVAKAYSEKYPNSTYEAEWYDEYNDTNTMGHWEVVKQ